jgi:hypothetical protein
MYIYKFPHYSSRYNNKNHFVPGHISIYMLPRNLKDIQIESKGLHYSILKVQKQD